jgi:hypothetical protein
MHAASGSAKGVVSTDRQPPLALDKGVAKGEQDRRQRFALRGDRDHRGVLDHGPMTESTRKGEMRSRHEAGAAPSDKERHSDRDPSARALHQLRTSNLFQSLRAAAAVRVRAKLTLHLDAAQRGEMV